MLNNVPGVSPLKENSLISQFSLDMTTELQSLECLLFLLCLYMFSEVLFLWYLALQTECAVMASYGLS